MHSGRCSSWASRTAQRSATRHSSESSTPTETEPAGTSSFMSPASGVPRGPGSGGRHLRGGPKALCRRAPGAGRSERVEDRGPAGVVLLGRDQPLVPQLRELAKALTRRGRAGWFGRRRVAAEVGGEVRRLAAVIGEERYRGGVAGTHPRVPGHAAGGGHLPHGEAHARHEREDEETCDRPAAARTAARTVEAAVPGRSVPVAGRQVAVAVGPEAPPRRMVSVAGERGARAGQEHGRGESERQQRTSRRERSPSHGANDRPRGSGTGPVRRTGGRG